MLETAIWITPLIVLGATTYMGSAIAFPARPLFSTDAIVEGASSLRTAPGKIGQVLK